MPDSTADALLVLYLADHDAPCPVCAYNLRGLAAEKCPECGAPIELGVRSNELRLREWIIGLTAWATGLGTSGAMTIVFISVWIRDGSLPNPLSPLFPILGGLFVNAICLTWWIRGLRSFRKMSTLKRFSLAMLSWPIAVSWIVIMWSLF